MILKVTWDVHDALLQLRPLYRKNPRTYLFLIYSIHIESIGLIIHSNFKIIDKPNYLDSLLRFYHFLILTWLFVSKLLHFLWVQILIEFYKFYFLIRLKHKIFLVFRNANFRFGTFTFIYKTRIQVSVLKI